MDKNLDINSRYFKIENDFKKGIISFTEYTKKIIDWNLDFSDIIKSIDSSNKFGNDLSHGGKLYKKQIVDKNGKTVTKWVSNKDSNSREKEEEKNIQDSKKSFTQAEEEKKYSLKEWEDKAPKASNKSLINASLFANSENIRRIARNEILKREMNLNKFIDLSFLPDYMINSFVDKYQDIDNSITEKENKSLSEYRDNGYIKINKKLRNKESLDIKESQIIDNINSAISKSKLKNDIVLHRGLSGKDSLLFINYLKSLKPGDIYEENSYSSTSLKQGQAYKFKDLYQNTDNLTLKIYASQGSQALCMHNLGSEDDKIMYDDEYEFLLPKNSKFQIIDNKDNILSVKLL